MTNGERTTILPGEKTPILPEVMEASYPGDPDLWSENPVARARRGLKGHSSYKAALGTFPLENEDNILCTMSWVEWPKDDYVPFNITLDKSLRLTLTIYLSGGSAIATVTGTNWSGFTYIRLNMVGIESAFMIGRILRGFIKLQIPAECHRFFQCFESTDKLEISANLASQISCIIESQ